MKYVLPLFLCILFNMCGCSTPSRNTMRCMLYHGSPISGLTKIYPNYCVVKLEGTNLIVSIYIQYAHQGRSTSEEDFNDNDLFEISSEGIEEIEKEINERLEKPLEEVLAEDLSHGYVYDRIQILDDTNINLNIGLTNIETNRLWKAFNWSIAATVPIRGGEYIVPPGTSCLRILTNADNKTGRCSVFLFACLLVKDELKQAEAKVYPYFIEPEERMSELCDIIYDVLKSNDRLYEAHIWNVFATVGKAYYNWRWDTYIKGNTEESYFQGVPEECYRY